MTRRRMRGQVMVITALVMTILISFVGLAIDYGHGAEVQTEAQSATDAAALAGAYDIYADAISNPLGALAQATADAQEVAQANGYSLASNYPQFWTSAGSNNKCGGTQTTTAPAVECVAAAVNTSVPTYFMNVVSINSITIGTTGAAIVTAGLPCVICILTPDPPTTPCTISASGHASLTVAGGILDGSFATGTTNSTAALCTSGSANISATTIGVGGTQIGPGVTVTTPPNQVTTGIQPILNPLSGVPAPTDPFSNSICYGSPSPACSTTGVCSAASPCSVSVTSSATICPGVYSNITVSGSATLTISTDPNICPSLAADPPVIVVTGSVQTTGGGSVSGGSSGVMLYLTCQGYPTPCKAGSGSGGGGTCGSTVGSFNITGGGNWDVPDMQTGVYAGIGIFQDINDTCPLSFTGNSDTSNNQGLVGTVYAADAGMTLSGNAANFDAALVVTSLTLTGDGTVDDIFTGNDIYTPSVPPQLAN